MNNDEKLRIDRILSHWVMENGKQQAPQKLEEHAEDSIMDNSLIERADALIGRYNRLLEAQRKETRALIEAEARDRAERDRMILEAFQEGPSEEDRIAQANLRSVSVEFLRDLRDTLF